MEILKDPYTQLHGRQGQEQAGVDVYGTDFHTQKLHGVQCKGKDAHYGKPITENELCSEVTKALTISPQHSQFFILATTAPRDKNIQKVACEVTAEQRSTSKMTVVVLGWEDICERIAMHPSIIDEF